MAKKVKMFEHLEAVSSIIPSSIYWLDINNVILGGNEKALQYAGGPSFYSVVGKTLYDIYPKEIADNIARHNQKVIQTGETLSQEESIKDITTGKIKYFNAIKAPLRDDTGNIIGTIGASIEITAEKEAEKLKIENEVQKTQLSEQDKFRKIADQVVHDIRSPLASLLMIVKSCNDIPESERIALREAAVGIEDIANNMLNYYKKEEAEDHTKKEKRQPMLVSLWLLQLLTDKKYQYKELPVKFSSEFSEDSCFAFINAEPVAFKRMLSNLVNNAVDALEGKEGEVVLKLEVNEKQIRLIIQDNGKGMLPEVQNKIMRNQAVTQGKKNGTGIGYTQVRDMLQRNEGKLQINSVAGKGTEVMLEFARIETPHWIAKEIILHPDDTVVILDDDVSIHGAWKAKFKLCAPEIPLKHFKFSEETVNFINNVPDKNKLFLLTDFELLKQELNGLHVIEKTKLHRCILVTSHYSNYVVRELALKSGTKMLPKQLASDIPIIINNK